MDRVDYEGGGLELASGTEDRVEVRRRQHEAAVDGDAEPFGAAPDLFARFLCRDEQRGPSLGREAREHLENERGLADAWLAAENRHRAGDQPTSENSVELANPGRHGDGAFSADRS